MYRIIAAGLFCLLAAQHSGAAASPQLPERLVIANSASWVPYSFLDQNGEPRGILIDLWRLFAERNKIEVEFTLVDWEDSIELVRIGKADLHGGLIETETRKEVLHFFPTEIFRIRTLVFIDEGMEPQDLARLAGIPIGVVAATTEEEFLRVNFSNLSLKTYPNSRIMVESALSGEIQVFVADYPSGYYHLISMEALNRFATGPTLFTRPIFAATKKGDSDLLATIDAGTKKLAPSEIQRVYSRWFIPPEPMPVWLIPAAVVAFMLMVLAAVGYHSVSLRRTINVKTAALQASVKQLEEANQQLDRLAHTDPLTGLSNRLAFFEIAPREIERAKRYRRPLSLAILDVDRFKVINDRYGHQAGDTALKHLSANVLAQLRDSDVIARIGGEEFAILLPETEAQEATLLLERILTSISETPVRHEDQQISLSFSAGVTGYYDGAPLDALLANADRALYESKARGRSSVSLDLATNAGSP